MGEKLKMMLLFYQEPNVLKIHINQDQLIYHCPT